MSGYALVVDDNPTDVLILKALVEVEGYIPITAGNGHDAIDLLDQHEFSIMIVDLQMPFMGGFEFIKRVRANSTYKSIPVLVTSARKEPADVKKATDCGANDYLIKPVDREVFSTKFNNVKGSQKSWKKYELIPDSKFKPSFFQQGMELVGLSEVEADYNSAQPLEKGEVLSIGGEIFDGECILAKVKNCSKVEKMYRVTFSFVGLSIKQRTNIRVKCKSIWNEQFEENKNDEKKEKGAS